MKANNFDTICAPATVRGESAIAVIRISGSETFSIVSKIIKINKDFSQLEHKKAEVAYLIDNNQTVIDKVLLTPFYGPNSFTGEDLIEISTHGSPTVVDKTIELLIENGCRLAKEGEFTKRAFIHGKMNLVEAESIIDVIESKTDKILSYATKNLMGDLNKKLSIYSKNLMNLLEKLNLAIDFDEEFVEETNWRKIKQSIEDTIKKIEKDIQNSKKMMKEKRGVIVLLLGPTNSGKSTLMNTILDEERAIVSEIAGTTRDYISEELVIKGHHVRLYDTAGLRENADQLEKLGIKKTRELIDMADIAIYLREYNTKLTNKKVYSHLKNDSSIEFLEVINKIDLYNKNKIQYKNDRIYISAKDKINIDELMNRLLNKIEKLTSMKKIDTIVLNQRQLDYLIRLKNSLKETVKNIQQTPFEELISEQIQEAIEILEIIQGRKITEEMLNNIFDRFCIGK
ncbi:MAG: tRNA uridine-5-carboxymethylaminomethyl(34) synthesis GTPase MnmE [Candidatus Mcinerneyibacterium aminivorans]|uniref:tRNA modification GTPase MnmE n=1 Tax=Candidatus Mcinerneyibacterium aminivorans TaxID=2703815 RepID=A0A5D0MK00_9BACT|nr:MAG: tRNA uridine-5-carboxymethylaminomethyl(34) synthesis GTPase MnmE [Candidatus Mcinerneyibacterium aminivorans]